MTFFKCHPKAVFCSQPVSILRYCSPPPSEKSESLWFMKLTIFQPRMRYGYEYSSHEKSESTFFVNDLMDIWSMNAYIRQSSSISASCHLYKWRLEEQRGVKYQSTHIFFLWSSFNHWSIISTESFNKVATSVSLHLFTST